ncbi:Error-prone, lesion bypass DNA polymerase V (UmuC) [Cronobacter dublinensis 582]|nr:Error-prone, lesion bypass DNA polymerase V (UmuC) [Cronobacter dublinensis 582]
MIARSREAKALGIKMGMPWFQLREMQFPQRIIAFSSNYELYGDMSQRVMTTLEEMCPRVEVYSIDEAFCDLTGVRNCRDLADFGREIRDIVRRNTRIHCGVGIAQTKTLAKLANRAAKEWPQTGGVVELSNLTRQRRLMALMPVEEVWGVGRRIARKLEAMGIKNALQLCDTDIRFIRKHFNVVLERTVRELRGEPCLEIEEFAPAKQEIVCSRSFGERITDYEAMRQAICSYRARAAALMPSCKSITTSAVAAGLSVNIETPLKSVFWMSTLLAWRAARLSIFVKFCEKRQFTRIERARARRKSSAANISSAGTFQCS